MMAQPPIYYASEGTVQLLGGRVVIEFDSGGSPIRVSLDANATLLLSLRCRTATNELLTAAARSGAEIIPFRPKRRRRATSASK